MSTRVVLKRDGASHALSAVEDVTAYRVASIACPSCGDAPLRVAGTGMRPSADDRAYEADGVCIKCRNNVGLIRADVDTLFGVREDMAVLRGRARVY